MVMIIGYVEITGAVRGYSLDGIADGESRKKLRIEGRTAVAGKARCSIARDGAVGPQTERVQRKAGGGGWPAIAGKACGAGAGEEGQHTLTSTENWRRENGNRRQPRGHAASGFLRRHVVHIAPTV